MNALTFGSLFAGIGGFDLGLERAGMRCLWQCEIDPFCERVLAKHWPDVLRVRDIRQLQAEDVPGVDVLCGGFPCPVVSQAARGRNVASSLWPEYARLVREIRPNYVLVENVVGLLHCGRGFDRVLGGLAALGYDACWRVLRASDFGAQHHRARVWLVGYPHRDSQPDFSLDDEVAGLPELRQSVWRWQYRPRGVGVDDGLPDRLERLSALGNSLIPQVAQWIGERVIAYEIGLAA